MARKDTSRNSGGNLGFQAELFKTADKLRGNMEPSDYKHIALGLICLKYISDAWHKALLAEDKDEYLADNVFGVTKDVRWVHLQANARLPTIGTLIDDAMRAIKTVDCMVALSGQLFYSMQIPACLWFLARNKNPGKDLHDRRGQRTEAAIEANLKNPGYGA